MITSSVRSAFASAGDAQLLVLRGNEELARLIVGAIALRLRSFTGRFRRNRTGGQSFV